MSDKIIMTDCRFTCRIGINEVELAEPQEIIFDIVFFLDTTSAARSGSLNDTVDYTVAHTILKDHVENKSFRLIETMAEEVATLLLNHFPMTQQISVLLKKPGGLTGRNTAWAGIEIIRSR